MELMSAVLERGNMMRAYERVLRNKGAPGVDDMTVGDLKAHLKAHWPEIREQLQAGRYHPLAVRKVEIPKPGGGTRMLGIPTVQDRLIQQALHQVLSPLFEETFSIHSYGFRPGRSAAQAVQQARSYIKDKRVLKLIRSYLQAGIMEGGVATARTEGTPQGGPLSPLLSNILLTDLDRELERRGHRFCRYADDCNIYVRSRRAGERVLASMTRFLETRLKLRVNREKSAVDRPWKRTFLGYTVCQRKYNVRLKVAGKSVQRLKAKLKMLFRAGRGRSIWTTIAMLAPILRGWVNYFRYAGVKGIFEELDGWIRRHLRKILWRQWKRSVTRAKRLMRLGLSEVRAWKSATNGRGSWWNSGASHLNQALPKKFFDRLGLVSLMAQYHRLKCTA